MAIDKDKQTIALALASGLFFTVAANLPQAQSTCPRTDACLSFVAPETYTDGKAITGVTISYRIYRNNTLVSGPLITSAPGQMLSYRLRNEPPGMHSYNVTAVVNGIESEKSNTASKFIRAPGPTDGAIEDR